MSEFNITVDGGTSVRLPTAGKYVDRDIIVKSIGGSEDLNDVLTEQEALISTLKEILQNKSNGSVQYETWTITYVDGTVEQKEVAVL